MMHIAWILGFMGFYAHICMAENCHDFVARRDAHKEEMDHQKYMWQTPALYQDELHESPAACAQRAHAKVLKKIERYALLDNVVPSIAYEPLASLWGGIHYGMSLEEMKQSVNALFHAMHAEGKSFFAPILKQ